MTQESKPSRQWADSNSPLPESRKQLPHSSAGMPRRVRETGGPTRSVPRGEVPALARRLMTPSEDSSI